jgi:hypothetical protein
VTTAKGTAQRLDRIEQRLDRLEAAIVPLIDLLPSVGEELAAIREDVAKRNNKPNGENSDTGNPDRK